MTEASPIASEHAPFNPDGPLCPLLDDPKLLFKIYSASPETRDAVKRMMKKLVPTRPGQILKKDDPNQMGEALRSLLNSGRRRAEIRAKDPNGSTPIHVALYQWLLADSHDFINDVTTESGAKVVDERVFFRPENLESYLSKHGVPADDSQKKLLALLTAAFAFFEPANAQGLVGALAARGEPFASWFAVKASA
jgi:hypothetical protein